MLKHTEGRLEGLWISCIDTDTSREYTLSYNHGVDLILITETVTVRLDEEGLPMTTYEPVDFFYGTWPYYDSIEELLEDAEYYIKRNHYLVDSVYGTPLVVRADREDLVDFDPAEVNRYSYGTAKYLGLLK